MTTSAPDRHIAQSNLRWAPYVACVAGPAAISLGFFVPFHPLFITVAAAFGALTFAIQWFAVRRRASLAFIGSLLTMVAYAESKRLLLPRGMTTADHALTGAQFLAVWMLVFAVLHILFRARLKKVLDDRNA